MSDKVVLNEYDRQSTCWMNVKAHAEKRLNILRTKLEGPQDERATAALRGSIAELKVLLTIGEDLPNIDL